MSRAWSFRHDDEKTKRPQAAYDDYAFEQGVTALTVLSRLHGKAVAPEDVRRHCRKGVFDVAEMLNCGRALGMKFRAHNLRLVGAPATDLAGHWRAEAGGFMFLGQIVEDRVVVAD